MPKLSKKLTISLTEEDYEFVTKAAEDDLRSTAQYVSLIVMRELQKRRTSEKVVKAA